MGIRYWLALAMAVILGHSRAFAADKPSPPTAGPGGGEVDSARSLAWHLALDQAIDESRREDRMILAIAGATWCGWCRRLEEEIADPKVQVELKGLIRVKVDVDEAPAEARRLNATSLPALRILDSAGRIVRSHNGYLPADKLLLWLQGKESDDGEVEMESQKPVPELADSTLTELIGLLGVRDAIRREVAMRRLEAGPEVARSAVVEAFVDGTLASRLSAMEILSTWGAPIGEIDPWQPATMTPAHVEAIENWARSASPQKPSVPELSEEQLAECRRDIARLATVDPAEVDAIGARLARYGAALLPDIRKERERSESDAVRERYDWLRYRVTGSDRLAIAWPDGLIRLAATETAVRQGAAGELAERVTSQDEMLLVELLGHPDSFVREMSLKALDTVGSSSSSEKLTELLNDPDPNVRAAVLKQLSENPSSRTVPHIVRYIAGEKDPDLVAQAVRLLKEIGGRKAVECLITLFNNESWQVRAEAVEAVGEAVSMRNAYRFANREASDAALQADAYTALLDVLSDSDGFVVSRAVTALKESDLPIAAPRLLKAGEKYPEFAPIIADALMNGSQIRNAATPGLKKWLTSSESRLRAAAIEHLGKGYSLEGEEELVPALSDPTVIVRKAAAAQLLALCENERPSQARQKTLMKSQSSPSVTGLLFNALLGIGGSTTPTEPAIPADENSEPPALEAPESAETQADSSGTESWLLKFLAGEDRPEWMSTAIDPLQMMLKSSDADERLAAAVPLAALGQQETALPVLLQDAKERPTSAPRAAAVLPWLPWDKRVEVFHALRSLIQNAHAQTIVAHNMVVMRDLRASPLLWNTLAEPGMTGNEAELVTRDLLENHGLEYYPNYGSNQAPKPIGLDQVEVRKYAVTGSLWQRRVALSILYRIDESAAAEAAEESLKDAAIDKAIKEDALAVILLSSDAAAARERAAAILSEGDPALLRPAMAYLTLGRSAIQNLANGEMSLMTSHSYEDTSSSEQPDLPKGLTVARLQPLLKGSDPDAAAQAAYLAARLGDESGMDLLIAHWRQSTKQKAEWEKLVYQAIAALDRPEYVPILVEIYESMSKGRQYEVRDFYWTIRSMHGPAALALRKRIRSEVGMDSLQ